MYAPLEWSKVPLRYLTPRIKLIDFCNTFLSGDPSSDSEGGFNNSYAAPEVLAGSRATPASDIWGLACVIFEIRSGRQLISQGHFGSKDSALNDIKETLGLLPALQRETQTMERPPNEAAQPEIVTGESGDVNDGQAMANTHQKETASSNAVEERSIDVPQLDCDRANGYRARGSPPTSDSSPVDRRLRQRILGIGKPEVWETNGPQEGSFPDPLTGEEAADLEDLLASMLKYDAAERMTLDQVCAHRRFSKSYAPDMEGDWLQKWS